MTNRLINNLFTVGAGVILVAICTRIGWVAPIEVEGVTFFNKGDFPRAAAAFSREVVKHPIDLGLRLSYAVTLLQLKQNKDALVQINKAAQMAPSAGIIKNLALSAETKDRNSKPTSSSLRLKASSQPGNNFFVQVGQDGSIGTLTLAARAQPRSAPVATLLGDAYQLTGRPEQAEQWYGKAMALAPQWSKPAVNLAVSLIDSEPSRAASLLEDVLRREPANAQAQLWLGDAYSRTGKRDQAMRSYQQAEASPQTSTEAKLRLGTNYLNSRDAPKAEQQFRDVQRIDPGNVAAQAGMAQSYSLQNRSTDANTNMAGAQQSSQAASPEIQAGVLLNRAQVARSSNDYVEADKWYFDASQANPSNQTIYLEMAQLYQKQNALPENIAAREKRLEAEPSDVPSLRFLSEAYKLTGDHSKRLDILRRLTASDQPDVWQWKVEVGNALWSKGDRESALRSWLDAVDVGYPTRTIAIGRAIMDHSAEAWVIAQLTQFQKTRTGIHLLYAIYTHQQKWSEALETINLVIAIDPQNATLYGQKAYVLRKLGRNQDAEETRRNQLNLTPQNKPTRSQKNH